MTTERAAGDVSVWLRATAAVARGDGDADVACDGCTACCSSSQFVHIGPHETDALAAIPAELLFPAPGAPSGHVLMGYDEQGRCPMLGESGCSIYEHRPRTCRVYDCRVFAATGVAPDPSKPLIAAAAGQWKFAADTERGTAELAALRSAADFVRTHAAAEVFRAAQHSATGLAVIAIEVHDAFIGRDEGDVEPTELLETLATRRADAAQGQVD